MEFGSFYLVSIMIRKSDTIIPGFYQLLSDPIVNLNFVDFLKGVPIF